MKVAHWTTMSSVTWMNHSAKKDHCCLDRQPPLNPASLPVSLVSVGQSCYQSAKSSTEATTSPPSTRITDMGISVCARKTKLLHLNLCELNLWNIDFLSSVRDAGSVFFTFTRYLSCGLGERRLGKHPSTSTPLLTEIYSSAVTSEEQINDNKLNNSKWLIHIVLWRNVKFEIILVNRSYSTSASCSNTFYVVRFVVVHLFR